MNVSNLFAPAVVSARTWLNEIAEILDISPDDPRALHALRAGLHAVRARLPLNEVIDLGAQLPTLIRGIFYDGLSSHHTPGRIRTVDDMIAQVKVELGTEKRLPPLDVLRAVIHAIVNHVSEGEIRDVVATLPAPIAALWRDLTGHVVDSTHANIKHTGYSR